MWIECKCFWQREHSGKSKPPSWWKKGEADSTVLTLPPYTACTWCYEAMYKDEVSSSVSGKTYDNDKRQKNAEAYFAQFEEGKSLVFYYAGYSNPFSEEEEDTYVIVGLSRIRKIDDFHYYENTTEKIRADYGRRCNMAETDYIQLSK